MGCWCFPVVITPWPDTLYGTIGSCKPCCTLPLCSPARLFCRSWCAFESVRWSSTRPRVRKYIVVLTTILISTPAWVGCSAWSVFRLTPIPCKKGWWTDPFMESSRRSTLFSEAPRVGIGPAFHVLCPKLTTAAMTNLCSKLSHVFCFQLSTYSEDKPQCYWRKLESGIVFVFACSFFKVEWQIRKWEKVISVTG